MTDTNLSWKVFQALYPQAHVDVYEDNHGPDIVTWYEKRPLPGQKKPAGHRPIDFAASMDAVRLMVMPRVCELKRTVRYSLLLAREAGVQEFNRSTLNTVVWATPEMHCRAFLALMREMQPNSDPTSKKTAS